MATTRVTFARDYTDSDGKNHRAGATKNIDAGLARALIHRGTVRAAEETPATAGTPPEPVKATETEGADRG